MPVASVDVSTPYTPDQRKLFASISDPGIMKENVISLRTDPVSTGICSGLAYYGLSFGVVSFAGLAHLLIVNRVRSTCCLNQGES